MSRFRIATWSEQIEPTALDANVVSDSYFDSVGARVTSGTAFPADLESEGCRVAIVNTEAEEQYFGGHAVGRVLLNPAGQRVEVVGVVKTLPLRVSQRVIEPAIYYPTLQNFLPRMTMIIGTVGPVDPIVKKLKELLPPLNRVVAPRIVTLDQHLSWTSLASERITTTLVGVCAAMALVLSMMGVYGAMADAVERRRQELALRVALGAQGWRLVRHVLWEGARLSAAGAFAGGLAALALERWVLHTPPGAPVAFAWLAAPLSLAVTVMLAAVVPARRAVRADPLTLMKDA
jgi:ABC-type antimicrobial peptide transport system permease subunit